MHPVCIARVRFPIDQHFLFLFLELENFDYEEIRVKSIMACDLEGLIASLLVVISCAGESGK